MTGHKLLYLEVFLQHLLLDDVSHDISVVHNTVKQEINDGESVNRGKLSLLLLELLLSECCHFVFSSDLADHVQLIHRCLEGLVGKFERLVVQSLVYVGECACYLRFLLFKIVFGFVKFVRLILSGGRAVQRVHFLGLVEY